MSEELYREICTQKQFGRLTPLQGTNLTTVFGKNCLESLGLRESDLKHVRLFVEYNKLHAKLTGSAPVVDTHGLLLSDARELVEKLRMFTHNLTRLCELYPPKTLEALVQHSLREVDASSNIEMFSATLLNWKQRCRSSTQLLGDFEETNTVLANASGTQVRETLECLSTACFDSICTERLSTACSQATALLELTNLQFQPANDPTLRRFGQYARLILQCEAGAILPILCPEQHATESENLLFSCERLFSFVLSESHTSDDLENLYLLFSSFSFADNCIAPCETLASMTVSKAFGVLSEVLFCTALALTFCTDREIARKAANDIITVTDHVSAVGEFFACPLPIAFEELCCVLDSLTEGHESLWSCEDTLRPWLPAQFTPILCSRYRNRFGAFQRPRALSDYTASDRQMYYKWLGVQDANDSNLHNLHKAMDSCDPCMLDITRERLQHLRNDQACRLATAGGRVVLTTPHYILHDLEEEWDDCWSSSEL